MLHLKQDRPTRPPTRSILHLRLVTNGPAELSDITTPSWPQLVSDMSDPHKNESVETIHGRLLEFMERGREDRAELKEEIKDFRQAIQGLQQSSITANGIMAELSRQNLGERVAQLEARYNEIEESLWPTDRINWIEVRVKRWDGWIGGGKTFLFKVLGGLLGSSVIAGLIVSQILKLSGKL